MNENDTILANALKAREFHEETMRKHMNEEQNIDNVAVLFSDQRAEQRFADHCISWGWEEFNTSEDHVRGTLNRENYDVRFRFLRPDMGDRPFRIETMLLDPADSALHRGLLQAYGQGAIAQGSFKYNGSNALSSYQHGNALLAARGWRLVEAFSSTYGPYTYFVPPVRTFEHGYLKVRRNERDH